MGVMRQGWLEELESGLLDTKKRGEKREIIYW